jgi:hypothetical protein
MYTVECRPVPTSTLTLTPREILLIAQSIEEAVEEEAEYGNDSQAAELAVLYRRFVRAHDSLIPH